MQHLNLIKPLLSGLVLLCSFCCFGQVDGNIPLGVLPMQFNSSFAGEAEALRLNFAFSYNHKDNNRNINQSFGYHASADKFIPSIRSGVGFSVSRHAYTFKTKQLPDESYKIDNEKDIFEMVVAIAPKFSIKGKYTLSPSLDFGYRRDDNNLHFAPQYSTINHRLQSRIGLLFNTRKFYIAYAAYLIRHNWHTNVEPFFLESGLASFFQAGYTFQRRAESKFSFTPQLVCKLAQNADGQAVFHILPNLTFRYAKFIAGVNNTGIHVGYQSEKLRIMLSGIPWGYGEVGPFSSGNMAVRHIFKD